MLVKVYPFKTYVLVDKGVYYAYEKGSKLLEYIPAIRLDTGRKHSIINYDNILQELDVLPATVPFDSSLTTLHEIFNSLR